MSIAITITDGTSTVTLSGTDGYTEDYQPVVPDPGADSVYETLQITWFGGNSTIDANLAKLERLFQQARDRQEVSRGLSAVYFKVAIDGVTWRSELYDGKMVATPNWIKGERAIGTRKNSLILQRAPWWEADSEAQISLTNDNGTDNTSGLPVYNINDATGTSPTKRVNYFEVAAAKVSGDLPAPMRLLLKSDTTAEIDQMMIAHNVHSDPANLVTTYEGETGSGDTNDADCSAGKYHAYTGSTINLLNTISTMVPKLQSGYCRVLARLEGVAGVLSWKVRADLFADKHYYGPAQRIDLTDFTSNFGWFDLGILNIPPQYIPGINYNAFQFGFEAVGSGSGTIRVDCIHLAPLDGWRQISMFSLIDGIKTIVLDESLGQIYGLNSSGEIFNFGSATGSPLRVFPGQLQRFQLVWNNLSQHRALIRDVLVKLFYRPRRRAL